MAEHKCTSLSHESCPLCSWAADHQATGGKQVGGAQGLQACLSWTRPMLKSWAGLTDVPRVLGLYLQGLAEPRMSA